MRKKFVTLLLLGTLMIAAACSGKDAADVDEPSGGLPQAKNTAQPQATPEPKGSSDSKAVPGPEETTKTNTVPEQSAVPESKATQVLAAPQSEELEYEVEELIASIKVPEEWYTFSCDKDKVIFYSRGEEYGWLAPYKVTPVKGVSEIDSIIHDLSGASGIVELIDTREEENATRYVFAVHRSRYVMGEVEFLAQERTELFIAYKVNGAQWWGFGIKSDIFGGEGLLDALEFEIKFL